MPINKRLAGIAVPSFSGTLCKPLKVQDRAVYKDLQGNYYMKKTRFKRTCTPSDSAPRNTK